MELGKGKETPHPLPRKALAVPPASGMVITRGDKGL